MHNLQVMVQFMRRDITVYARRIVTNLVNDAIIRPIFAALVFGYVFPRVALHAVNPGMLYIGNLLYILTPLAYGLNIDYLLDIEREKSIEYKLLVLPASYILWGRVLVTAILMMSGLLLSLPIAYAVGRMFDFSQVCWGALMSMAFMAALCVTSLTLCFMSGMKGTYQSRWFWRRTVYPLVMFGGFYAPWTTMMHISPILGYLVLLNPFLYITEGLRSVFFGGTFIPWYYCCCALLIFSILFVTLARYLLQKNIDYV